MWNDAFWYHFARMANFTALRCAPELEWGLFTIIYVIIRFRFLIFFFNSLFWAENRKVEKLQVWTWKKKKNSWILHFIFFPYTRNVAYPGISWHWSGVVVKESERKYNFFIWINAHEKICELKENVKFFYFFHFWKTYDEWATLKIERVMITAVDLRKNRFIEFIKNN